MRVGTVRSESLLYFLFKKQRIAVESSPEEICGNE